MARRIAERPFVVLAVDLDESGADAPQDLCADRLVVDEGARTSVRHLDPAKDHVTVVRDFAGAQDFAGDVLGPEAEGAGDLALRLARPDETAVAARAEGEAERIEQDGLAGAGLSRQH